jgi:hypothetical protein
MDPRIIATDTMGWAKVTHAAMTPEALLYHNVSYSVEAAHPALPWI